MMVYPSRTLNASEYHLLACSPPRKRNGQLSNLPESMPADFKLIPFEYGKLLPQSIIISAILSVEAATNYRFLDQSAPETESSERSCVKASTATKKCLLLRKPSKRNSAVLLAHQKRQARFPLRKQVKVDEGNRTTKEVGCCRMIVGYVAAVSQRREFEKGALGTTEWCDPELTYYLILYVQSIFQNSQHSVAPSVLFDCLLSMAPDTRKFAKRKVGPDGLTKQQRYLLKPEKKAKAYAGNRERIAAARKRLKEAGVNQKTPPRSMKTDTKTRYQIFSLRVLGAAEYGDYTMDCLNTAQDSERLEATKQRLKPDAGLYGNMRLMSNERSRFTTDEDRMALDTLSDDLEHLEELEREELEMEGRGFEDD
ncbi:hypothetical protein BDZ97DRAFT_1766712 [Flammula alnicola]|nr:hypothetical protein BDZ97DRAFT_1766712 [Flammula alnicola]